MIEKLDLSDLPDSDMGTVNMHTLALERIEFKINEMIDVVNELKEKQK